ncbi:hypothetical protein DFH08DRAFT_899719 [Mycena albidolilacea]|uniref:Uncharacterized protein n=1 Tax=Mycena albidolilacea TaxID=1033008 RepID=A0AAD6Z699_9AGAR|nr:hypothetical protein DFH08DRAFT_899719 [Mycena albidolilacea]
MAARPREIRGGRGRRTARLRQPCACCCPYTRCSGGGGERSAFVRSAPSGRPPLHHTYLPIAALRWKGCRGRNRARQEGGGRREENVEGVEGMCIPSLSIRCGAPMHLLTRSLACLKKRYGCARRRGRPGMGECSFWLSMHTWCFEIVRGTETSSSLLRFGSGAHAQRGGRGESMCAAALNDEEGVLDMAATRRRARRHHALLDLNC